MNVPTGALIAFTVVSMAVVLAIAFLVKRNYEWPMGSLPTTMLSFILGFMAALCIIAFFKGVIPFFKGIHIPFNAILILWPMCSVPLVPIISRIEITGNVIIDAIIAGAVFVVLITFMASGLWNIFQGEHISGLLQFWMFLSFFASIGIRAIFWALE